jgi:vacuolar-type H+-ATPase subunit E/Vma4
MPSIDEKLEMFNRMIIGDATKSRDAIMKQLKDEADKKLADSQAEIDREAAELSAKERLKATQQSEARISKANIGARKALMAARGEIVASVLGELRERLGEFAQSDGYGEYLANSVRETLAYVGPGAADVYLAPRDCERHGAAIQALYPELRLARGDAAMIGGCRVANERLGIYADNTLAKKAEMCADELYRISGLRIGE